MCSINVTAAVSAIGILFASQIAAAAAEAPTFRVARGERQLFLDDYDIAEIKNLNRTMHQPDKKGAVIRPSDPHVTALQTRSAPAWDPDRKVWKMWDCTTPADMYLPKPFYCSGYYESTDGLHWTKPIVRQVERNGSRENNYVYIRPDSGWGRPDMVVRDASDPNPSRRYKSVLPNLGFAVSPDGIRWMMLQGIAPIPSADEYNLSLDEREHLFVLTVKGGGPHGRSVHLATSKDFKTWTKHGLIFHADDLDQELGRENIKARFADPTLQQPSYLGLFTKH